MTNSPWAKPVTMESAGVIVRWESAPPVIAACAEGGMEKYLFTCASKLLYLSGLGQKFAGMVEHFYILSISNYPKLPVIGAGLHPPEHSAAANAELAEAAGRMRQTTSLTADTGVPVKPVDVVILPAGDALLALFFFERTQLRLEGKSYIVFDSTHGTIHVTTRFQLAEMQENGKPAL